ncbi:FAD-dependent oxidoreductase [Allosalinactinospora lopnorensis]|uniref:FAD-dependent oxidoreductase n=1 Tax=Allosalinactinospora lopnorensis TaxID=1352348 RepID=UPI00191C2DD4|nr:FAD-dependent oxidoreductase [Allosalinactinospora lopnorensis]
MTSVAAASGTSAASAVQAFHQGPFPTATRTVTREAAAPTRRLRADVCVLGAGISGVTAAVEAARLGLDVLLVDGLPAIGGQAVHSIIGTFCGLFGNGSHGPQLTHGLADDLLGDLGAQGALHYRHGPMTTVVMYDEVALARWVDRQILDSGVTTLTGAFVRSVQRDGRRVRRIDVATRYGPVSVEATSFVDASGDAALVWDAGLPCREPEDGPIYGTQMLVVENLDEEHAPERGLVSERLWERGREYGLTRRDGFAFSFKGRGIALVNMTHIDTPLDPVELSANGLRGRLEAARALDFLKGEFPRCFADAGSGPSACRGSARPAGSPGSTS